MYRAKIMIGIWPAPHSMVEGYRLSICKHLL